MSDLSMPEMNGEQLFWELQKVNPNVRMILCFGYLNGTDLNGMMKAGLKGFLQKPFYKLDPLREALEKAIF